MMTIDQVVAKIESEGLGYFVTAYASAEDMPTPELAAALRTAQDALNAFEEAVNKLHAASGS